ncbi:MAG: class I SAM-dependent methyltransferase [Candidatus Kapabacteria bacterium]|jgi:ubiquinone/menaquinone biosynthesis C-methylase UbiE|nr:class I SAM-dependent methyltransferase [Candidatus Kapabacteria bacterium]
MNEETLKSIAAQLRKPEGEYAVQIGEFMNNGNLLINLNAIENLKLHDGDHILEIGMGNGFFVKNILSAGDSIKYSGCDYSEIMVNESLNRNKEFVLNGRATFFQADAENLPFENESFDKVMTVNTIYFWENPEAVLAEIRRILKPEGMIVIGIRPKRTMEKYPFVKYGFNMFSKDDLVSLLSDNFFKVESIIEQIEPEQEYEGEKMIVENLVVCACQNL